VPSVEPNADDFFASRSGVCVYVTVRGTSFRVQFASASAHGVVTEGAPEWAELALEVARAAVQKHRATLAPLFEKVARGQS